MDADMDVELDVSDKSTNSNESVNSSNWDSSVNSDTSLGSDFSGMSVDPKKYTFRRAGDNETNKLTTMIFNEYLRLDEVFQSYFRHNQCKAIPVPCFLMEEVILEYLKQSVTDNLCVVAIHRPHNKIVGTLRLIPQTRPAPPMVPQQDQQSTSTVSQYHGPSSVEPKYQMQSFIEPQCQTSTFAEPQYQTPSYMETQHQQSSPTVPQYQFPSFMEPQYQTPSYTEPQCHQYDQWPSPTVPQYQQPSSTVPQYQMSSSMAPQYQQSSSTVPQYQQPTSMIHQYQQPAPMASEYQAPTPTTMSDLFDALDIMSDKNLIFNFYPQARNALMLSLLCVDKDYRGKGLEKHLLRWAIEYAHDEDIDVAWGTFTTRESKIFAEQAGLTTAIESFKLAEFRSAQGASTFDVWGKDADVLACDVLRWKLDQCRYRNLFEEETNQSRLMAVSEDEDL